MPLKETAEPPAASTELVEATAKALEDADREWRKASGYTGSPVHRPAYFWSLANHLIKKPTQAMTPRRIQLQRRKGWKKPEDAVVISRPSPWGNPFVPEAGPGGWLLAVVGKARGDARVMDIAREANATAPWPSRAAAVHVAVAAFRRLHDNELSRQSMRHHLRGKPVACWCKVGDPCHGDVLLEFANETTPTTCGQSRADATAEKTDLSAPGAPRIAPPADAVENSKSVWHLPTKN